MRTASPIQDLLRSFNNEVEASLRCASPTQSVCRASLEALGKHASITSMSSLQRYIETPATDEAIPLEAVDAIVRQYAETADLHQFSGTTLNEQFNAPTSRAASSQHSYSVAGSKSSRGSAKSYTTQNSFKSRDSRGSRRGRKLWVRAKKQADEEAPELLFPPPRPATIDEFRSDSPRRLEPAESEVPLLPYFCTVPSCTASFRYRYEWARHEEALHYEPYHWICCRPYVDTRHIARCFICHEQNTTIGHVMIEHFASCMHKRREEVTFLREDQFLQHISGVHIQTRATRAICREVLSLCKVDNADIQSSALHCGFCGGVFSNWAERQDHVFKHLKLGACKSAWWPGRLPLPSALKTWIGGCNNCTYLSQDFIVKPYEHLQCVAWSCRYLLDHHSIFVTGVTEQTVTEETAVVLKSICKLCKTEVCSTEDDLNYESYKIKIQQHADLHHLRSCRQEQFSDLDAFVNHLVAQHGTSWSPALDHMLDSWKCQQRAKFVPGEFVIWTLQAFQPSHICSSRVSAFDDQPILLRVLLGQ